MTMSDNTECRDPIARRQADLALGVAAGLSGEHLDWFLELLESERDDPVRFWGRTNDAD